MSNVKDRIMQIFIEESSEIIQQLEKDLMLLEEKPSEKSIINEIFS